MNATRERLPEVRYGKTHKFVIHSQDEMGNPKNVEGFFTANTYPDGRFGEIFITMDKEGTTVSGFLDIIGTLISVSVQCGVSLEKICEKMSYTRFSPMGITENREIPFAKSISDYVAQWLGQEFLGWPKRSIIGMVSVIEEVVDPYATVNSNAPFCDICGKQMQPSGACFSCANCGITSGCG